MTLRTYAQELAAVAAVLEPRRVKARKWARPELWECLAVSLCRDDGYCLFGRVSITRLTNGYRGAFAGGMRGSFCFCGADWHTAACEHQLGLAALWAGGHPIQSDPQYWNADLERELEGGAH